VTVGRNGASFGAKAWWGNNTDSNYWPITVWWDAGTGLLLRYEEPTWAFMAGRVVDTDAPLTRA